MKGIQNKCDCNFFFPSLYSTLLAAFHLRLEKAFSSSGINEGGKSFTVNLFFFFRRIQYTHS